jgi:hypothetical protein
MQFIETLRELESLFQAGFERNEESLDEFGKTKSTQLKAYLVESNLPINNIPCPTITDIWHKLESSNWYSIRDASSPNSLFLDTSRGRIWVLYSLMDAQKSDYLINKWVKDTRCLDKCWLSRNQLLHWENLSNGWIERGIGIKFSDGLSPEETAGNLSFKAWYGVNRNIPGLSSLIQNAKNDFAIASTRWQKRSEDGGSLSVEWYSNGKVTINRATNVDEVLMWVGEMADRYTESLMHATDLRNSNMGAFEIDFTQGIDLDAFSDTVSKGRGNMNLWLIEMEKSPDFRRYKGVDLHTWDRILLDVGLDYVYLTVPGDGCINAAPRLAVTQGEDNAGKAAIYHDGEEVFA